MGITVEGRMVWRNRGTVDERAQKYPDAEGLRRVERREVTAESDFATGICTRESPDNGRTWGEWQDAYADAFETLPNGDERMVYAWQPDVWNPVHRHWVSCGMERIFENGHTDAYRRYWGEGVPSFRDHCYLCVRVPGEDGKGGAVTRMLVKYEDGAEYDPANPRDPMYLTRNQAYFGKLKIMRNGDILFPVGANIASCCRILGLDVGKVFPSCPEIMTGFIVVRGVWDGKCYRMRYSEPGVISDMQSSRAFCEPELAELTTGRILLVLRGSNFVSLPFRTRISPCAPGFKWYALSDDGGRTFTPAMPWHFDTREVVYSSATISALIRAQKTGRLYWIGNITDPTQTSGNSPRWPLVICEVDEEWGCLRKETLTVIDTKRPGEADVLQLSNFNVLEDRETGDLEIRLTKLGQFSNTPAVSIYDCETWEYRICLS